MPTHNISQNVQNFHKFRSTISKDARYIPIFNRITINSIVASEMLVFKNIFFGIRSVERRNSKVTDQHGLFDTISEHRISPNALSTK